MRPSVSLLTLTLIVTALPSLFAQSLSTTGIDPLRLAPYRQLIATRSTQKNPLPLLPALALPADVAALSLPQGEQVVSWARTRSGNLWVTTNGSFPNGAYQFDSKGGGRRFFELPHTFKPGQPLPHVDSVIRYVLNDGTGQVWVASDQGVYITDGGDWWQTLNREDGMPYEDVVCLALAPNGDLWGGTTDGAWRLRNGEYRYFRGKRWLPGNQVNRIVVDAQGVVWLATDGGVGKIEERRMTLTEKAAHYEEITQARHNRRGYIMSSGLKTQGDPTGGVMMVASDNDGLWTAVYIGAESFRYAATKDPAARRSAKQSMEALLDLTRLSGYPGFPARAILRKDEVADGYDPNETVRVDGEPDKIWYTPPGHPELFCKGDTSSDELDGHYFAWHVYYMHVADAKEKEEIRKVCRAVTNNILDHDYNLVGHTGRKTRWGVFGPQYMNDDPRWWDQRGLNSLQMLTYLKIAYTLCGDKRFSDAYEELIAKHHYLLNTLNIRQRPPWWAINHSDDQLSHLNFYSYLQLERDPRRRAIVLQSLSQGWKGGNAIREEHSPFYNFLYGALTGAPCKAEEGIETLQDWPWELIDWRMQNSRRHDVTMRTALGVRKSELDRVLPVGERALAKWNGNPWSADGGDDGRSEEDGAAWLISYWLGRYHRLIVE